MVDVIFLNRHSDIDRSSKLSGEDRDVRIGPASAGNLEDSFLALLQ
jgi:hypothetical protein